MAARGVERTAFGAGMMRALEGHVRQPLFDDPLAGRLVTGWPAAVVASGPLRWAFLGLMERVGPGFYGAVVCRTRVIDDACREALAGGIGQVVILENPRHAGWARRLHWQTSFHPPELAGRLAGLGLNVLSDLGAEDYQERLLRPLGRTLDVFGGERVVVAEKAGIRTG